MMEELPDEILSTIISFLSVKEAVRTSILSKRWENLYLFMSRLNFDADSDTFMLSDYSSGKEHVKSVCKLLQHYLDSSIESFRLWVPDDRKFWQYIDQMAKERQKNGDILGYMNMIVVANESKKDSEFGNYTDDVDYRWIRLAIKMGAEELKLIRFHSFSFKMLSGSKLKHFHLQHCTIPPPAKEIGAKEVFFFRESTIAYPGISLKCLQIFSPINLDQLQVSAPNLTYFEYRSDDPDGYTELSFSNVPKLEEMVLDTQLENWTVDDMFTDFATDAPQLKRLMSLHTTLDFNLEPRVRVTSTILCQLEQLELILDINDCNFFNMIPILVACPLLQKFHLTTSGRPTDVPDMRYPRRYPFPNLKEVKIRKFYFTLSEIPFVFYMLKNVIALERMILDTTPKCCRDCKIKHLSHELPNQRIRAKLASPTAKLVLQHHSDERIDFSNPDYLQFWSHIDYELLEDYLVGIYDGSYRWIRSAMLMGAEELNFTYLDHYVHHKHRATRRFSFQILSGLLPSKLKHLRLQNCSITPPAKVSGHQPKLHSLATLELEDLLVDQTALGTIFSTCVNLWKLVLRKLQVSAEKLSYFEYQSTNPNTQLSFSNVPELEEMILDLQLGNRRVDDMFTDFAPQLKRLMSLHTTLDFKLEPQIPVTSTILCQLEQLELELILGCWRNCNLLKMIPILVACPLLQKFHLIASGQPTNVPDMQYPSSKHPFPNLKQVKIRKFYATSSEIPFVFYMLEDAVALEQMILDTTPKSCRDCKIKHLSHELPNQRIRAKVASSSWFSNIILMRGLILPKYLCGDVKAM
ncbi:hypothetical protein COLO4_36720 [Corchorus olitorius]|uniref:F-box domain-containing protein n=1 Tax=Corchorus olitorius TaxID=93759 RepID=A0A1R3G601_9ROSI|nr:hypothetical protein COLO4_36720 [Corchorus olitorius]